MLRPTSPMTGFRSSRRRRVELPRPARLCRGRPPTGRVALVGRQHRVGLPRTLRSADPGDDVAHVRRVESGPRRWRRTRCGWRRDGQDGQTSCPSRCSGKTAGGVADAAAVATDDWIDRIFTCGSSPRGSRPTKPEHVTADVSILSVRQGRVPWWAGSQATRARPTTWWSARSLGEPRSRVGWRSRGRGVIASRPGSPTSSSW